MDNPTPITEQVTEMATVFTEIHSLYLKCYKDSSPHPIASQNASNYLFQLLATCEITLVRRNGLLVGCIIYQPFHNILLNQEELFIQEWFIHPAWRKKLVGKQLLDQIDKIGRERNCTRLRGISYNMEMIHTIRKHSGGKTAGLMFEREL
jgi:GNAT superfamily N-acetyltransferase